MRVAIGVSRNRKGFGAYQQFILRGSNCSGNVASLLFFLAQQCSWRLYVSRVRWYPAARRFRGMCAGEHRRAACF